MASISINQRECSYHECKNDLTNQDEIYVEKKQDDIGFGTSAEFYHNAYCSRGCRRTQKRQNRNLGAETDEPITSYTISTSKVHFS
jgi:hypothetical protein